MSEFRATHHFIHACHCYGKPHTRERQPYHLKSYFFWIIDALFGADKFFHNHPWASPIIIIRSSRRKKMIAPRKTLWSTPLSAVDHCMERVPLQSNDVVCDIGCGDGRIIHQWAVLLSEALSARGEPEMAEKISFKGIDIDSDRIQEATQTAEQLKSSGKILPGIKIEFVCKNAMESGAHFRDTTVIFLYLIPRGLKKIYPLIIGEREKQQTPPGKQRRDLRIVSYMSKLPVLTPQ
jgi:hypothetical protein